MFYIKVRSRLRSRLRSRPIFYNKARSRLRSRFLSRPVLYNKVRSRLGPAFGPRAYFRFASLLLDAVSLGIHQQLHTLGQSLAQSRHTLPKSTVRSPALPTEASLRALALAIGLRTVAQTMLLDAAGGAQDPCRPARFPNLGGMWSKKCQ